MLGLKAKVALAAMLPDVRVPHLEAVQMWRPIHFDPRSEDRRDWRGFLAFARLRDGVSIDEVRRDVASIAADIQRTHSSYPEGSVLATGLVDSPLR